MARKKQERVPRGVAPSPRGDQMMPRFGQMPSEGAPTGAAEGMIQGPNPSQGNGTPRGLQAMINRKRK